MTANWGNDTNRGYDTSPLRKKTNWQHNCIGLAMDVLKYVIKTEDKDTKNLIFASQMLY